jgi:hypothetical protein
MKRFILPLLILSSISAFSQKNCCPWLKTGTELKYDFFNLLQEYDFTITGLVLDQGARFQWNMGDPVNMEGIIKISAEALNTSLAMVNHFRNGGLDLTDKTTVWVSTAVHRSMKKATPLQISIDGKSHLLKFVKNSDFEFMLDEKKSSVPVLYCESDQGAKIWILDNAKSPLILKMELDFVVELKRVISSNP